MDDEDLRTVAGSLPQRDGADVDRYLEALATADDDTFDALLNAWRATSARSWRR